MGRRRRERRERFALVAPSMCGEPANPTPPPCQPTRSRLMRRQAGGATPQARRLTQGAILKAEERERSGEQRSRGEGGSRGWHRLQASDDTWTFPSLPTSPNLSSSHSTFHLAFPFPPSYCILIHICSPPNTVALPLPRIALAPSRASRPPHRRRRSARRAAQIQTLKKYETGCDASSCSASLADMRRAKLLP